PQTKFVLSKALNLGLKPIVVINKIDRDDQRIGEVIDEVFELFVALEANNDQLDFPIVYASGRAGRSSLTFDDKINPLDNLADDLAPLFDLIVQHVPTPAADDKAPFSMLVTTREYNSFFGRVLTGRVQSGTVKINQNVKVLNRENKVLETGRITKILAFRGLERIAIDEATAGDIIAVAGVENANVADTICAPEVTQAVPSLPIDPPTLSMTFSVNDSPLAGSEGTKVTSSLIGARLMRELESNVALKVTETAENNAFQVAGRGELQLGILIETMRREGFELSISRPEVLFQTDEKGNKQEPMEEIQVDVDDDYVGVVVKSLALRKAEMTDMRPSGGGKSRVTFIGPSRGLIGYHSQFLTETRGTGIMHRIFHGYADYKGAIEGRRNGVLISNGDGAAVAYALWNLEERGKMFINPSDKVYRGMIIGEHNRDNDLEVNPLKAKQLSNVRASGKDEAIRLTPPVLLTLEQAISYIENDERVEVTPKSIRLRKAMLDPNDRKRAAK
ncbi:MAG: EF-Tu/IF-2/RF-3 family GTPase, partial [Rickettsia sp.]